MRQMYKGLAVALTMLAVGFGWAGRANATTDGADAAATAERVAQSILADIDQATWVSEGHGPHVVYIFFDPNCPYCHKLYEEIRPWVKEGKLQLRWIPVGILTTTSEGKAASILQAKDPLAAFYQNENHYRRGGGIEEGLATTAVQNKLQANANLLARTGFGAVPTLVFRADDGEAVMVPGAPPLDKLQKLLQHVK